MPRRVPPPERRNKSDYFCFAALPGSKNPAHGERNFSFLKSHLRPKITFEVPSFSNEKPREAGFRLDAEHKKSPPHGDVIYINFRAAVGTRPFFQCIGGERGR